MGLDAVGMSSLSIGQSIATDSSANQPSEYFAESSAKLPFEQRKILALTHRFLSALFPQMPYDWLRRADVSQYSAMVVRQKVRTHTKYCMAYIHIDITTYI